MKFHRIQIENINSLYGPNEIDIDRDFDGVPLFLIMGPTGSGKTTILDAICLALFGATPRQPTGRGIGGSSGIASRVNSVGTWQSKSVVEFSLFDAHQGVRTYYRASWLFERANQEPDGTPKTPKRVLEKRRADGRWTDKPLTSSDKEKEFQPAFDDVLDGMALDHFLRSVMLAQGDFAALLSADKKEKIAILDRITDTSAYQKVGVLAYERMKEEHALFKELESKIEGVEDVSEDVLATERARLSQAQDDARRLERCQNTALERLDWLKADAALNAAAERAGEALKVAEAEREARADEMARVELHDQASPARDAILELARLNKEQSLNQAKLPTLLEAVQNSKVELEAAQAAEATAQQNLQAAEAAFEAQKPKLAAAKNAQTAQETAKADVERAAEKVQACEAKRVEVKALFDQATQAFEGAQQKQKQLADEIEKTAEHAIIAEKLPHLQAGYDRLNDKRAQAASERQKQDEFRGLVETKSAALESLDAKVAAQKSKAEPLRKAVDDAHQVLENLLGDADDARMRRDEILAEDRRLEKRQVALEALLDKVDERRKKRTMRDSFEDFYQSEMKGISGIDAELATLGAQRAENDEELAENAAALTAIGRSLLANELRQNLEHGQDCPVCGSLEHPKKSGHGEDWASEQESADLAEQARLNAARASLVERGEALAKQEKSLKERKDTLVPSVTEAQTRLNMTVEEITKLDAVIAQIEADAGLEPRISHLEFAQFESEYEALMSALRLKREQLEAKKDKLDDAENDLAAAKLSFDALDKTLKGFEQEQRDAQKELELARERLASVVDAIQSTEAQTETLRQNCCELFAQIGVDIGQDAEGRYLFDAGFETATARRDAWDKNQAALERVKEETREAEKSLHQYQGDLKNAQEQLKERQAELQAYRLKLEAADKALAEHLAPFDGKKPAEVEAFHEDMIKAARALHARRAEARQQVAIAVENAQSAHANTQDALKAIAEKLGETQSELDEIIEEIAANNPALSTIDAVQDALLADEEYRALKELYDGIRRRLRDAQRDVERVASEQEAHQAKCPEDFEASLYSVEVLEQVHQQLKEAVRDKNTAVGRLDVIVEGIAKQLAELGKYREQRDAQKLRYDGWKELNELIGTSTGDKFKEFAQALHLGRIVARANLHLQRLRPRYVLDTQLGKGNLPTLDFEIIDKENADQRRSLSSLSGGETFLVSLALALALADQQRIRVPMETLFLDEGFGTLDRESLQQAMETLQHLHASIGRTVVVISHVEALKDKIAHQIVVTRELPNRSKVVVPALV
ncbi:AAA family ATPase [Bradymonas sediminis]|uniref:Uncharacterized protein n=1 Tax=Bradymonas sediminis TaxID=1548548 RepID=A0A2Z4FNG1_9DELT|nr:AAA family ATPase [Bradymonas sediminis]AWV90400.1 hypothetical protein DN745_14110 [Bradymonas sediminis]TDP72214.1 DNA repair exonuclease SbcCD ATPase subunit [Bradymonas sediminis]